MCGMLNGKVCLVTGAGRGIGKEITRLFLEEGALVIANVRKESALDDLKENYICDSERLVTLCFDLEDDASIKNAVREIKKKYNRIDVLVNNAGIVTNESIGMISLENMKKMFDVNVFGMMELTQLIVSRFMVRQKSGSVINITSMVAVDGCKGQIAYSASKGAIISITKSMAKEVSGNNIRVNAIAPGLIETERIQNTIECMYKGRIPNIGMKRLGTAEDIAQACLFFASDLSRYTTGQILGVHGDISL